LNGRLANSRKETRTTEPSAVDGARWPTLSAWLSIGWPTLLRFCFLQRVGHSSLRLASAGILQPVPAAVQPAISTIPYKILNRLIPACYPVPVFAEMDPRQVFPSSNLSAVHLPHYPPKSFPFMIFADPHPLNPVASIFYKNIGGRGTLRRTPPIFHSLSPIPYELSPFFSNSCALFSTCEKLNPFYFQTPPHSLRKTTRGRGHCYSRVLRASRREDRAHSISQQTNSVCLW